MFVRVKKVGTYQYLQIAQNRRQGKRVKQSVIATLGRLDKLTASGAIDQLLRSAARFRGRDGSTMFSRCIHFTTAIADPFRRKLSNTSRMASTIERSGSNTICSMWS